jgi:hypothetical protein
VTLAFIRAVDAHFCDGGNRDVTEKQERIQAGGAAQRRHLGVMASLGLPDLVQACCGETVREGEREREREREREKRILGRGGFRCCGAQG